MAQAAVMDKSVQLALPTAQVSRAAVQVVPRRQPEPTSVRGMATSPLQVVQGRPGAWKGLVQGMLLRSTLIAGGLFIAGVRKPGTLAAGSLLASGTISALQVAQHASNPRRPA